jgi:hypothetical protein
MHQTFSLFGTFTLERDPLGLHDILAGVVTWVQVAGGFAALAALVWAVVRAARRMLLPEPASGERAPAWQRVVFWACLVAALLAYLPGVAVALADVAWAASTPGAAPPATRLAALRRAQSASLFAGGLFALLAVGLPFLARAPGLRARRILALARLSFKEALRRRVLWAFTGLLLVFLFASWFIPHKPEDQVRSYVGVVSYAMSWLLLTTSAILAAFSIPADIRQQTIQTVLTKPVERFEVVLGRFLGFAALMTLVLAGLTAVSLVYVLRGVDPDAAADSLKAREPLYGELRFENSDDERKGANVGREWGYRGYITGGTPGVNKPPELAAWGFAADPALAASRGDPQADKVRCEFSFDIYRTSKGEENKGVSCTFFFVTRNFVRGREQAYQEERRALLRQGGKSEAQVDDELAEKYGYFEVPSKEVVDYHTLSVDVPAGLFRNALRAEGPSYNVTGDPIEDAPVKVRVRCNSPQQYVGMAKYDLYFRLDRQEGNDRARFAWNFFKGSVGLWARLCLVIALATALSTYLSGVISLILTALLVIGGANVDFIREVAEGKNVGGGPLEAGLRLVRAELPAQPLEETAVTKFALRTDSVYRWVILQALWLLPDMDRFDATNYVAEGFNIPAEQLLTQVLLLAAYLVPFGLFAYYLMKWREIASAT